MYSNSIQSTNVASRFAINEMTLRELSLTEVNLVSGGEISQTLTLIAGGALAAAEASSMWCATIVLL